MDSTQELPCIVFRLNEDKYALNIQYITEITKVGTFSLLPEMPPHMLGLFRFRDRVVPLVDLKTRLGLAREVQVTHDNDERIIVVNDNGNWLGLKVDAIHEVVQIRESQSLEVEGRSANLHEAVDGVYAIGDEHVTVLKFDTVIDPNKTIDLANWKKAVGI